MNQEVDAGVEYSEPEIRAAVGPRVDFYLRKWKGSRNCGFNWAALLLSGLWLPYRKMYRLTGLLLAFIILESAAEELIFLGWLGRPEVPPLLDRAVGPAISFACGTLGNRWYLTHVKRLVAGAQTQQPDATLRLEVLAAQGGTSLVGALVAFVLFLVALFGAVLAVDAVLGLAG